jgi:DNA-binding beta-propeller fold protein YncE
MARMRFGRRRLTRIALLVVLVAVLAVVGGLYLNWRTTRSTGLDLSTLVSASNGNQLAAPQFLYAFAGPGGIQLQQPVGILADGDKVYVTDADRSLIYEFNLDGSFVRTFGKGVVKTPLYMAKNPKTGDIWVTDRGTRSIHIFTAAGAYKGDFDPKLPKNQLPKFDTHGAQWIPVAIAFAPDGTLVATEILNGHRLLWFDPQGKFVRSVGNSGMVVKMDQGPNIFQFPNSVKVYGGAVFVADSNNRRIQVFDLQTGKFLRFIGTQGLPRGISMLPLGSQVPSASSEATNLAGRIVVVDTLAQDVSIWTTLNEKILSFGESGIGDGQFAYPDDVSVDSRSRIYVTDSQNARIQVWGWPSQANPIPTPQSPAQWALCLSPLLLLPFLLILRRKRFYATADFIQTMLAAGLASTMPGGRRRWTVLQDTYDMFSTVEVDGVVFSDLLEVSEYSESEARALQERMELTWPQAVDLSSAKVAKVFCTENVELRRLARLLDIDTVDREEYVRRFAKDAAVGPADGPGPSGGPPAATQ